MESGAASLTANLPIIFLITDGAVQNEHEIVAFAKSKADSFQQESKAARNSGKLTAAVAIRTFTFGEWSISTQHSTGV